MFHERRDSGLEGDRKGGFSSGGMLNKRDAGKKGCMNGGMQERRKEGKEG